MRNREADGEREVQGERKVQGERAAANLMMDAARPGAPQRA